MKKLKIILNSNTSFIKKIISLLFILFFVTSVYANQENFEIIGNKFSDSSVIFSLLDKQPEEISEDYSNYIIKKLLESGLFKNVSVEIKNNKYIISVIEFPSIDKFIFNENKRLKDEDLLNIANELNINSLSPYKIENYLNEVKNIYQSFGYNNITINYSEQIDDNQNSAELTFDFDEGEITKIKKVYFLGNENFDNETLFTIVKSKNRTLQNIFVNNNFKLFQIENDLLKLNKFYNNRGYRDALVSFEVEYLEDNKVEIYFNIKEGEKYYITDFSYNIGISNLDTKIENDIAEYIEDKNNNENIYSKENIEKYELGLADILTKYGISFFEIKTQEKIENNNAKILYNLLSAEPMYVNQINITGNSRTYDYVIRRELEISEGDSLNDIQLKKLTSKIKSLDLFKSVNISKNNIEDDLVDLEIEIEEKQTGTFNAGLSVGTIEGASFITGLNEKNIGGTGRSLEFLVNTSDSNTAYTIKTKERQFLEYDFDAEYGISYVQDDFTQSSSYKLNTLQVSSGIAYDITDNIAHKFTVNYELKEYIVSNSSTVSTAISNSRGTNVGIILQNNLYYNTLNSYLRPTNGNYLEYLNVLETPSSSNNGLIKNKITFKKFYEVNQDIISIQSMLGNVESLSGSEILPDDKFSLGGRWLRGFDIYGAGPRKSRNSYVGGKNLAALKLDYSIELLQNSDNPIYFNLFNDYGLVWGNKNKPANDDETIRSSYGFGLKFYSPIGPIGLTWGFPLVDEDYDIKRMFLFSIGNIN